MKKLKYILLLLILGLTLTSCINNDTDEQTQINNDSYTNTNEEQNETNLTTNENIMNSIQTKGLEDGDIVGIIKTSTGTIKIKLFTNLVPETTTNFIGLAKKGYYDGIIFHRVIKDFMIQTGDPTGTGMGGVSIYGEKFDDEFNKNLKNIPYSVSMANSGPDTNGSQFFINQVNNGHLDNKHSVFGQVVEGKDTVDKIAKTKTGENDKPEKEIKIINIEIKQYENGILKDYEFNLQEELKKLEEEKKVKMEAKKIKIVEKGDIVSVHYTGTIENGEKFDSSLDRGQPIEFEVGAGLMIKGFDEGVLNMKILDKKTLTLSPSEGYGEYDETKKQVIPKTELTSFTDAGIELVKGGVLPTQMGNLKIIETDDTTVTIDLNHELVGKTLIFDIEIVDIR